MIDTGRSEIVESLEDDNTVTKMSSLWTAASAASMIDAGRREIVESIFGKDSMSEFAPSVCDNWPDVEEIPQMDTVDLDAKYSVRLRRLLGWFTPKIIGFNICIVSSLHDD